MIPISCTENSFVQIIDSDGVVWRFKPMSGELEDKIESYWSNLRNESGINTLSSRDVVDAVLIGCEDPQGRFTLPKENPSKALTAPERNEIISLWYKANVLSTEEKKS